MEVEMETLGSAPAFCQPPRQPWHNPPMRKWVAAGVQRGLAQGFGGMLVLTGGL